MSQRLYHALIMQNAHQLEGTVKVWVALMYAGILNHSGEAGYIESSDSVVFQIFSRSSQDYIVTA